VVALAASVAIAVYLLIPYAIFRVVLGGFVPLRVFHENKTEEFAGASLTLIAIFLCSLWVIHNVPWVDAHPFQCSGDAQLRLSDYQQVVAAVWSDKEFHNNSSFWSALWRTADRQGRFLIWYYVIAAAFALLAAALISRYGSLQQRHKITAFFVRLAVVRHVSQWYALLTPFLSPDKNTAVRADVLMTDGVLYSGEIVDYFLDKNGDLSGLFLDGPTRFDRTAYVRERELWGTVRPTKEFWRKIPSAKLYLFALRIVNLNLTYTSPQASEDKLIQELAKDVHKGFTVTFEFKPHASSNLGQTTDTDY
jgi:hypothetical protein